jgi:hypothetical protein
MLRIRQAAALIFLFSLGAVVTSAVALPAPAACFFVGAMNLHRLPDGSLTDSPLLEDQQRFVELARAARARIASTFGPVESTPVLVFFTHPDGIGPFRLNAYGSTPTIGGRACVMVGPDGQNIDVVAHELMHAEIHHRVGYLKRWLQLPAWFDEGVAMQVDYRSRYALSEQDAAGADAVQKLNTFSAFRSGDSKTVVTNYARAKYKVASWLRRVGIKSLYQRLERMKSGQSFAEAMAE